MSKMKRRSALLGAVLLLLTLFGSARMTQAQSSPLAWSRVMGIPSSANLSGVALFGAMDAWAVGSQNAAGVIYHLHRQSDRWDVTLEATVGAPLHAVDVVSDQDVWAVGDLGLIMHKDAGGWHTVASPLPNITLTTVQMFSGGSEGWAGGYTEITSQTSGVQPVLLHYRNGAWERDTSIGGTGSIENLQINAGGGWAVGSDGIWQYRDGRWTYQTTPEPCMDGGICVGAMASVSALDGGEAWAAGVYSGLCAICVSHYFAIHYVEGAWRTVLPETSLIGEPADQGAPVASGFRAVSFGDSTHGVAVGWYNNTQALLASYHDGQWFYDTPPQLPQPVTLTAVSMSDAAHALTVGNNGLVLAYGYGASPAPAENPTARVPDPHNAAVTYFDLVGHTLRGAFRDYWQRHGGLAQFGYPLTEEYVEINQTDGRPYLVQYFERARFEYHGENAPPYDVLLGLLGHTITAGRESEPSFLPAPPQSQPGTRYFPETGHTLAAEFLPYWESHGGLPIYGFPISEAFVETNQADGRPYLVQYFERNRFEYHPELPEPYTVSLGLLGAEVLRGEGWLP
jgi:hypothetical protein